MHAGLTAPWNDAFGVTGLQLNGARFDATVDFYSFKASSLHVASSATLPAAWQQDLGVLAGQTVSLDGQIAAAPILDLQIGKADGQVSSTPSSTPGSRSAPRRSC